MPDLLADARIEDLFTSPKLTTIRSCPCSRDWAAQASMRIGRTSCGCWRRTSGSKCLPQIAEQYELLRAQYENELDVQVTSAVRDERRSSSPSSPRR